MVNRAEFIRLDNGLMVLMYSDMSKITGYFELVTFLGGKTRSYIDYNDVKCDILPGSAHFLEHFVCERNARGNFIDNLKELDCLEVNASTSNYVTSFYADVFDDFDSCLEMFLSCIYSPVFNKKNVDDTRYAVLNEIRDGNDSFRRMIGDRIIRNVFFNSVKTLGSRSSVNRITSKYLKKLFECCYTPSNQLLVLAGPFDREKMLSYVKSFYDNLSFKCNRRILFENENSYVVKKRDVFVCDIIEEVGISFKIDISKMSSFDRYKFDWYLGIFVLINFSRYSNINEIIKKNDDYTGDISCSRSFYGNFILFEIAVYTKCYDEFINLVINTIDNFRDNTRDEFNYLKKYYKTEVSVRKDSISGYIIPTICNYVQFNYPYDDTIEFIDSLNYDEYIEVIGSIDFSNYSYLCVKGK